MKKYSVGEENQNSDFGTAAFVQNGQKKNEGIPVGLLGPEPFPSPLAPLLLRHAKFKHTGANSHALSSTYGHLCLFHSGGKCRASPNPQGRHYHGTLQVVPTQTTLEHKGWKSP